MQEAQPLAVLGCGAISEFAYFPALAARDDWRARTWLVEPSAGRGRSVAERYGFRPEQVVLELGQLPPRVELAINATPSHLHLATTLAMIERSAGVLIEKPFAENASDAETMIAAAAGRCVLSVNQSRRAGPSNKLVRDLLASGKLGTVRRIDWQEGHKFDWPSRSGFNFRRPWKGRPRGVLLDIGVHVLDLVCWWLGGEAVVMTSEMDGYGGPEASASARLTVGGVPVDLKLSFLAKLKNQFVIEGTKGSIRGSTADYDRIELKMGDGAWKTLKARGAGDILGSTTRIVENVLAAAHGREPLLIDAASTLAPMRAIDEMYARARDVLPKCYSEFVEGTLPFPARVEGETVV